jgi:hypothetical protein
MYASLRSGRKVRDRHIRDNRDTYPITDKADFRVEGSLSPTIDAIRGNIFGASHTIMPFFLIKIAISSSAPCRVLETLDLRPCSWSNEKSLLDEKVLGRV